MYDLISKSLALFFYAVCFVMCSMFIVILVFLGGFLVVIFNFNTFLFQFYIYINDFLNNNFIVSSQDLV